jgi:hypothetical protein
MPCGNARRSYSDVQTLQSVSQPSAPVPSSTHDCPLFAPPVHSHAPLMHWLAVLHVSLVDPLLVLVEPELDVDPPELDVLPPELPPELDVELPSSLLHPIASAHADTIATATTTRWKIFMLRPGST